MDFPATSITISFHVRVEIKFYTCQTIYRCYSLTKFAETSSVYAIQIASIRLSVRYC